MRSAVCSDNPAMPPPSSVADYLDRLTRALRFDTALAHRVRQEVEDHLLEAAEIALAALLVVRLHRAARRAAVAASLTAAWRYAAFAWSSTRNQFSPAILRTFAGVVMRLSAPTRS